MIKSVTVRNFKSLHDVSVTLSPVTVLVGRSGTGKSNFVNAIRFLREFLRTNNPWSSEEFHPELIRPAGRSAFELQFEVSFQIPGIEQDFFYGVKLAHNEGQSEEILRLGTQTLLHHRSGAWKTPPNISPEPRIEMPMLGRLPAVSEAVIAYSALTTGIGCYEFPVGVLSAMGNASARGGADGFDDEGVNYLRVMRAIYSNLRDLNLRRSILASLSKVNLSVVALELDSITSPQKALVTHQFNGQRIQFPLAQESEGFRRFLAHLLAIYQEPPKQTLLFEEPENGIYPGALELLSWEFKTAPEAGRGQMILTTHSPGLLDHFDVDTIRVVELAGSQTRIGPVAQYQKESVKDGLLRTGELLTVDEARTENAEISSS
ncbi:MAG: AAA family ATPase [Planctomycetaceae bacterium]|nr:AAA family ATPase [Planctomycetaceae bacterium]